MQTAKLELYRCSVHWVLIHLGPPNSGLAMSRGQLDCDGVVVSVWPTVGLHH